MTDSLQKVTIGMVLASPAELEAMRPALEALDRFECPCATYIASVWAAPERLLAWAERAGQRGIRIILATAGAEPHLPGLVAAASQLPVIAVPLAVGSDDGFAALRAALQTSPAAPVAVTRPGGTEEAALLAIRILATGDPGLGLLLEEYRNSLVRELDSQMQRAAEGMVGRPAAAEVAGHAPAESAPVAEPLPTQAVPGVAGGGKESSIYFIDSDEGPVQVRPAFLDRPLLTGKPLRAEEPVFPTPLPVADKPPVPPRVLGRRRIDPDAPDFELIEEAVDCLLEGGIIAFPTDTVYGVAADATNPKAVELLYELKGRPRNKAIALLVDSPKLLSGIACNLTVETRRLMEAFWPGPLTVIFQKRGGNFQYISDRETIGVRMPDHSVPLAIMQALARPLACTSANLAGLPEALSADEVDEAFGHQLNLLLDSGRLRNSPPSTVIDVTDEPYKILRQGAVSRVQLAAVVGDKLEPEA